MPMERRPGDEPPHLPGGDSMTKVMRTLAPPARSRVTSSVSASLPDWYSLSLMPQVAQHRPAST